MNSTTPVTGVAFGSDHSEAHIAGRDHRCFLAVMFGRVSTSVRTIIASAARDYPRTTFNGNAISNGTSSDPPAPASRS